MKKDTKMKDIRNISLGFCALTVITLATSCLKEVVMSEAPEIVASETIAFNAVVDWGADADVITKGETLGNRLGNTTLTSADSSHTLPVGIYSKNGICPLEEAESIATRGSVIYADDVTSFTVWASLYGEDQTAQLFFPQEGLEFSDTDESGNAYTDGAFHSNPAYFWPGAGTLKFVAVANAPETGFTANLNKDATELESFTYTVPTVATEQNDIVIAVKEADGSSVTSQPLEFKHILSAINVKVGSLPEVGGTFESIILKNIYNKGTYTYTDENWEREGTKSDYIVLDQTHTPAEGEVLNSGTSTFMMIPQVLPDDAILEVKFKYTGATEAKTLTAYIAKDDETGAYYEWEQNQTTTYTISIDENFNLTVTPQGNVLDAHYIMTTIDVNVTELGENQEWYVNVSADGITTEDVSLLLTEDNGNAVTTVNQYIRDGYWINALDGSTSAIRGEKSYIGSSTGTYTFTVFIPENITAGDRKITIEYGIVGNESNAKFEYIYQKCPYWDTTNKWGWEKVDDQNSGPYGFDWTRKACYMFAYKIDGLQSSASGSLTQYTEEWIRALIGELVKTYNASDYVTIDTFTHYAWDNGITFPSLVVGRGWNEDGSRVAVIIDYTKLNFDDAMSSTDGLANTKAFFDARSLLAFEEALSTFKKYGEDGNAFRMLDTVIKGENLSEFTCGKFFFNNYTYTDPDTGETTNKMFREFGEADDASGILKYIIQRNAYDIVTYTLDNGSTGTTLNMDSENIKWYLPAYGQFQNYDGFEFATGDATFIPADFWSSTAAANNQAYTGEGKAIDRSETRKVIVQRKVDAIPTATASLSVDNTTMTASDNGEATWVE